jgi:hypothetical protein
LQERRHGTGGPLEFLGAADPVADAAPAGAHPLVADAVAVVVLTGATVMLACGVLRIAAVVARRRGPATAAPD